MNLFSPIAKSLLAFADSAVCTDDTGLKLFTWWPQVPGEGSTQKNVVAAATNGPLKEMAKASHGFVERATGREVFNVFCTPTNGRPYLPANRKPEYGVFFEAAMCIPGPDGYPVDADGNQLTIAPKDAKRYRAETCERHPQVSPHWYVEADPA